METEDRQDWNVFKQIFTDHWDGFGVKYPRLVWPGTDNTFGFQMMPMENLPYFIGE